MENSELKVETVKAINAKQVAVTFNKAIDKDSVIEATGANAGTLVDGVFVFNTLDSKTITANSAKGSLSEDGKTLTITAQTTEVFEGRYDVTIDGAKDKDGNAVEKYEVKNLDLGKDTTAPAITGTEQISSNKVKVKFSEPVQGGTITAKYADGTAIATSASFSITLTAGATEVVADLSHVDINVNKDIVVTFNGVQDMAGNLISPQPATATIVKLPVDGVEPTVSTITQTGAKKFTIKFNKDLDGNLVAADVTVGGVATSAVKKVSASEYEFTTTANLKGLQTVTVAANKAVDLAGQKNTNALSKVVTFTEDTVAPKAIAQLTTDKNNKQVIELTFDKDVTAGAVTVAGKQVKDYVTTSGISATPTAVYADGTGNNKKVLHIPLATPLNVEGAEYDLTISSANVQSDAGKNMDDVKVQFTRGKDGQAENVNTHVVSNVVVAQGADNNTVTATFTIPTGTSLDGATATNIANYVIDGAVVESVTLAAASGTSQVATLKLKEGSNTFTGVRNITVKNIKVAGSTKVMEPKTITDKSLNENVRPTITKSEVTDITLGSAGSSAVNANISSVTADNGNTGLTSNPTVTFSGSYNSGSTDKPAVNGVEFVYDGTNSVWTTTTTNVSVSDFTITPAGVETVQDGDKVTFDVSEYKAAVSPVTASSEITLTFSEAVTKAAAAVDFELFIGGEKSTATVATTAATDKTTLTVKIGKALTAEDFAKGVELKAASTLDIKDQVGNLLKVDGPIALTLN